MKAVMAMMAIIIRLVLLLLLVVVVTSIRSDKLQNILFPVSDDS